MYAIRSYYGTVVIPASMPNIVTAMRQMLAVSWTYLVIAEIVLFVKRYFGRLQVDKTFRTDNEGKASFIFPNDLPGDKNGNLELIVKVNDNNYGEIESNAILKKGIPTDKPALTEKRAIWNIMAKAPFWILLTYFLGVSLVLAVFLYIGCNLYKLWKLGNV